MRRPTKDPDGKELEIADVLINVPELIITSTHRSSNKPDHRDLETANVLVNFHQLHESARKRKHAEIESNSPNPYQSSETKEITLTINAEEKKSSGSASKRLTEAERREKARICRKKWYHRKTPEERKELNKKHSAAREEWLNNRTPEKKKADKERRNARRRELRAARTLEQVKKDNKKRRDQRKAEKERKKGQEGQASRAS